jgi:hypothetical protein
MNDSAGESQQQFNRWTDRPLTTEAVEKESPVLEAVNKQRVLDNGIYEERARQPGERVSAADVCWVLGLLELCCDFFGNMPLRNVPATCVSQGTTAVPALRMLRAAS